MYSLLPDADPMLFAKAYAVTLVIFLLVDAVWLGFIAKDFYARNLAHLLAEKVNWIAAGGFYLVYIGGIVYFAILPGLSQDSWKIALINGVFLGLIAYGTYDMTNLATLKDWPVIVSVVDMIWGGVLTGTTAVAGYFATRALS